MKYLLTLLGYAALAVTAHAGIEPISSPPTTSPGMTITGTGASCIKAGSDGLSLNADCTNKRVGVGTITPATKLHMSSGTLTIDGDVTPAINILNGAFRPAIKTKAPDCEIVAAGVSCRQQIPHGTGRRARHLVEVLADALP